MWKTIALPRLNGLRPTVISTVIKLVEELGELAEVVYKQHPNGELGEQISLILKMAIMCGQYARSVGKHSGLNGENLTEKAPDLSSEMQELNKVLAQYHPVLSPEIEITDDNYINELTKELLDCAQVSVTFLYVLDSMGVNTNRALEKHIQKMRDKGYLEKEGADHE